MFESKSGSIQILKRMPNLKLIAERRTTTDHVFDSLHDDIVALKLPPGTKMSEAEVAEKFGVSRQPVRDAFNRLSNLDLLLIRPQKATVVRGFSMEKVEEARFLRLAVELEVLRSACQVWNKAYSKKAKACIAKQQKAVSTEQWDTLHNLDSEFHALICESSGYRFAFGTIESCRQKTDRLCALSFNREKEVETIIEDHKGIVNALDNNDPSQCDDIIRLHLRRLDPVIAEIQLKHSEYIE